MKNLILLFVLSIALTACVSEFKKPALDIDVSQAKPYAVIKTQTYATPRDKKGLEIFIYAPSANNFDQRGQTLIKAAHELLIANELHEVIVKMSALATTSPKYIHAGRVYYAPQKTNTWGQTEKYVWEVEASYQKIFDGKLEENGKLYPLDLMPIKPYLKL